MGSTGLVGRRIELAAVAEGLDQLARGRGQVVLIAGAAGLGKSRLAAEAFALSRGRGMLAVWGRCRETDGAPAFWPWAQVLRALRTEIGVALDEVLGPAAAFLAHEDADLGCRVAVTDPFLVYDAVARALGRLARGRPLCVVLDDLHGADVGSLRMLRFVLGELESSPIAIIGTYRDDELGDDDVLKKIVGELATSGHTRLFALDGLDADDVASLVEAITGSPVEPATARAICARTGGNPFFVTEVARLGVDGPVPHGVREAVRARLARLPDATRAVLSTSSVLGRDFGGELLEEVSGVHGVSLIAMLQPAAQAGLISGDPDRQGRYRFVHALVQEVLYSSMPDERRRDMHARACVAIEALAPPERARRLDELAFHASAAVRDASSRARAAALCEAAGRRAEAVLAYEDAARWYRRSLELDAEPASRELDLLFAQADSLARTPQTREARIRYEQAFDRATRTGDAAAMSRAALGVADVVVSAGRVDQGLVRMLTTAGRLVPAGDPVSVRLEARHAIEIYWQAERADARAAAARALARAEGAGDPKALGAALHARRFVLRGPDDLEERIALGERLVQLALDTGDEELERSAYTSLIPEHFEAGDVAAVDRALSALDGLERRERRPLARWQVGLFQCMRMAFAGRFDGLLDAIERTRALGRRIGSQPADMYAAGQRALVLRDLDRGDESILELRELAAAYPILVTLQCDLALLLAEAGEGAEAREILDRIAGDRFALVPRDPLWRASIALAAQAAATLGRAEHARTAAALLLPHAGINVVQGVPVAWGAADHYIGTALAAAGDPDAAIVYLDDAVRLHAAWGAGALLTASRAELANALLARGRAEDRPRVAGLEAAVRAEAKRLGIARPLLLRERVVGARPTAKGRPGGGSGLTEREATILRLLAAGEANKDIAAKLRISVHTVERHLANLYAKIGASSRTEAVAFAAARGLTS